MSWASRAGADRSQHAGRRRARACRREGGRHPLRGRRGSTLPGHGAARPTKVGKPRTGRARPLAALLPDRPRRLWPAVAADLAGPAARRRASASCSRTMCWPMPRARSWSPCRRSGSDDGFAAFLETLRHGLPRLLSRRAAPLSRRRRARASRRWPSSPPRCRTPLVATNDVLYHAPERRPLQDVLTCIREHCTIDQAGFRLAANAERHLKPPAEMARLFRDHPEALARTPRDRRRLPLLPRRAALRLSDRPGAGRA